MNWQRLSQHMQLPLAGLVALLGLTGCAASGGSSATNQGVACAAPSLFVAEHSAPTVVTTTAGHADLSRLDILAQHGCDLQAVLTQLDVQSTGDPEQRRFEIAEALLASGRTEMAIDWFERAQSFAAYQRLLDLHAPTGPLADDAAYLRYEVKRARLQQAFGEEVAWPVVSQAQPLFVSTSRSALYADTDPDAVIIEGLAADERVYLLDVVVLEDGESYWVHAYYPPTLSLGWVPAETLAQYPHHVQQRLGELDQHEGRTYAQQLLFSALIHGMNLSQLQPLADTDFFGGAEAQQRNSLALLQRLGTVTEACVAESERLEENLAHYLMDEGPAPTSQQAPYSQDMRVALAALTQTPLATNTVDDAELAELRAELRSLAHQYFRIRVAGQIDQRLCHSLPSAAGSPEYATQTCALSGQLQACVNRVDAILAH